MRTVLAAAALFVVSCAAVPGPPPQNLAAVPRTAGHFRILQINDVYKIEGLDGGTVGGLARVRWLREHLGTDGTPVLVLHGGDALYPSVMSKYLEAKPMVDVLNLLDGDAQKHDSHLLVTFGNHELDNRDATTLLARVKESQFTWIVSNTVYCPTANECAPFHTAADQIGKAVVIDVGGAKVGFFGLLYPFEKTYAKSSDVIGAAKEAMEIMRREGAEVVIAVTHQNMPDDIDLVKAVPGIDIVIGGHDHLYQQTREGQTWITKADADAKSVIVYDVVVPSSGDVKSAPVRMMLDETVPKDADVDAAVQRWMSALSQQLGGNTTIGYTKSILEGVEPAVRGRETALGNLLADVARERMMTDVAVINGGGIRINDNIPAGPITTYDMEGVFYYANTLVAFEATGAQLLDMLRNSVSLVDAGDGRFLQVSGMKFRYRKRNGQYAVDAADVTINGQPLDLNRVYSIATIDYLYQRGSEDGYTLFADDNRPPKFHTAREADFRTIVEEWIRKRGTIETNIEGRIVRE